MSEILIVADAPEKGEAVARLVGAEHGVRVTDGGIAGGADAQNLLGVAPDLVILSMQSLDAAVQWLQRTEPQRKNRMATLLLVDSPAEALRADRIVDVEEILVDRGDPSELQLRLRRVLRRNDFRFSTRYSRELLQMIETAPVPVAVFRGRDLRIELANEAICRAWGKTPAIIGRALLDALPEIRGQGFDALLLRVMESGEPFHAHERQVRLNRSGDGEIEDTWFDFIYAPIRATDGSGDGVYVCAVEVTAQVVARQRTEELLGRIERKNAELLRSEGRLRTVIAAASEIIWIIDTEGRIVEDCDSWQQFTGQSAEQMRGFGWLSVIHHGDRLRIWSRMEERLAAAVPFTGAYRLKKADGSWAHMEISAAPILDEDGRVIEWIGTSTDVTEKRKLQTQLALSDRLASVGTLSAGVAHEINNPMAFIVANVSWALEECKALAGRVEDEAVPEIIQALSEARLGTDRVQTIVRDLKSFARSDEIEIQPIDLRVALDRAASLASSTFRHRAKLVKDYEPIPLACVNEAKVGQVFLNLIVNAAQAIREGNQQENEIRLRTGVAEEGSVWVEVQDTGEGIAPEALERIFDPFFTTKPIGEGTGLGLSICHGIVKSMQGRIEVTTTVGEGTSFRVHLPVSPLR